MAPCGAVCGGVVIVFTIYPEELATEIDDEVDWEKWCSLVDCSDILESCGAIFFNWDNQGFGSEGLLSS